MERSSLIVSWELEVEKRRQIEGAIIEKNGIKNQGLGLITEEKWDDFGVITKDERFIIITEKCWKKMEF